MIENNILKFLQSRLECRVALEREPNMVPPFVLIEKTGSSIENHINSATFTIQSYGQSLFKAAVLNEEIKEIMFQFSEQENIGKCSLNSDYNYTDTETKEYRYQAVFDIYY